MSAGLAVSEITVICVSHSRFSFKDWYLLFVFPSVVAGFKDFNERIPPSKLAIDGNELFNKIWRFPSSLYVNDNCDISRQVSGRRAEMGGFTLCLQTIPG